jgi:hypothetical protein
MHQIKFPKKNMLLSQNQISRKKYVACTKSNFQKKIFCFHRIKFPKIYMLLAQNQISKKKYVAFTESNFQKKYVACTKSKCPRLRALPYTEALLQFTETSLKFT